ncbi:MAG TPA: GNAT family N-acetyltransferase [Mycobacteriales bacterium]|nr:GNAT family N-acetyltransferase [Mycobacteriales bacterium]
MPAHAFGPTDIGQVVTLRTVTAAGPADVVGTLLAVSPGEIVLRRRDGQTMTIPEASVTHARVVPPGPAQTINPQELERLMVDGWRPLDVEPLGDWLLRASGGFTRRGNSALPLGSPGRSLADAVEAVESWYDARGLTPRVQLTLDGTEAPVADELTARGWRAEIGVHVMTAELAPVLRAWRDADGTTPVRLDDTPDDDWLALYRSESGPLPDVGPRELLVNHPAAGFASVREDGRSVAIARATADGRWAGLFAVEVAVSHRRRGLGRTVSIAALRWAAQRGARRAYLQVAHGNDSAVALYESLGFAVHHDYVHHVHDGADATAK